MKARARGNRLERSAVATGDPDTLCEALASLDAALARAEEGEERWFHPELLRAKAELLVLRDGPDAAAAACDLLRAAADLAHAQGALRYELRTATTLVQVEDLAPSSFDARAALAQVLDRFREGFDTSDLVRARRLLEDRPAWSSV